MSCVAAGKTADSGAGGGRTHARWLGMTSAAARELEEKLEEMGGELVGDITYQPSRFYDYFSVTLEIKFCPDRLAEYIARTDGQERGTA